MGGDGETSQGHKPHRKPQKKGKKNDKNKDKSMSTFKNMSIT